MTFSNTVSRTEEFEFNNSNERMRHKEKDIATWTHRNTNVLR